MESTAPWIWQIAYPQQIATHEHMTGPKRFIEAVTAHCHAAGDLVVQLPWVQIPETQKAITLNFHTYGYGPLNFHYKESYLDDWIQVDTMGHSGWHSSNFFKGKLNCALMPYLPSRRARMPQKLANYIASKKSKYIQKDAPAEIAGNYLFFPLQRPDDETSFFARFRPEEIAAAALSWCRENNYKLVIKRHPYCVSARIADWLQTMASLSEVVITEGDVVKIFANAAGVLTINSSVGFEALLRGLPVFCFGASEYGYLTHEIFDLKQLGTALGAALPAKSPPNMEALYDFAAVHLYDTHDVEDIADLCAALKAHAATASARPGWMPAPLPEEVNFSQNGNGIDYILHGFSSPENWGCWTNHKHASLAFLSHEKETVLKKLHIATGAYVIPQHPMMLFDVLWNGKGTGRWHNIKEENPFIDMNMVVPVQPGLNILSFSIINPVQPADLPSDFDVRLRGLALLRLRFSEVI